MTSDVWTWSTSWIQVSTVGLVLVALQGPLLAGRRAHVLKQALTENGPGPLAERAKRMTCDRVLWFVTFVNPAIVLAIAWNMTEKPGTAGAIVALVVAYVVGVAVAMPFTKASVVGAAAPDPAG
jgi:hypothetical protein